MALVIFSLSGNSVLSQEKEGAKNENEKLFDNCKQAQNKI